MYVQNILDLAQAAREATSAKRRAPSAKHRELSAERQATRVRTVEAATGQRMQQSNEDLNIDQSARANK